MILAMRVPSPPMFPRTAAITSLLALIVAGCQNAPDPMTGTDRPQAPIAPEEPYIHKAHGQERVDEFHWMRLSEEQRNAAQPDAHTQKVVAHLTAENAYTEAVLAPVKELKETLFQEMKGRMKETDLSVPYRENGYWYHYRYEEGKEYPVHVRRRDEPGATEQDILNENLLTDLVFCQLAALSLSPRHLSFERCIVCF